MAGNLGVAGLHPLPGRAVGRRPGGRGWVVTVLLVLTGAALGVVAVWFLQRPAWDPVAAGEIAGRPWQAEARIDADGVLLLRLTNAGARTEVEVAVPEDPGTDGVLAEPFNVDGTPFLVGATRDSVGAVTVEFASGTATVTPAALPHSDGPWRAVALPWTGTILDVEFRGAR